MRLKIFAHVVYVTYLWVSCWNFCHFFLNLLADFHLWNTKKSSSWGRIAFITCHLCLLKIVIIVMTHFPCQSFCDMLALWPASQRPKRSIKLSFITICGLCAARCWPQATNHICCHYTFSLSFFFYKCIYLITQGTSVFSQMRSKIGFDL